MARHERTLGGYRVPDARRVSGWFRSMAIPPPEFPGVGQAGDRGDCRRCHANRCAPAYPRGGWYGLNERIKKQGAVWLPLTAIF